MKDNIPGDFLEAGVWRGGSCIFARAVLDVYKSKRLVRLPHKIFMDPRS
jgi:hypothetical protein